MNSQNGASVASRSRAAHHSAVTVDIRSVVRLPNENLGTRFVAHIAGVDPQTASRWVSDQKRQPRDIHERRLRATYQVLRQLQAVEAAPAMRAWSMGMNAQLEDASPAEALAGVSELLAFSGVGAWALDAYSVVT